MASSPPRSSVPWSRVVLFFVTATALSYPFRHALFDWYTALEPVLGLPVIQAMLEGSGPFVGAAVFTVGFRRQWRPVSFVGTSPSRASLTMAVPPLVFAIIGLPNSEDISPHLYGLCAGLLVLGYLRPRRSRLARISTERPRFSPRLATLRAGWPSLVRMAPEFPFSHHYNRPGKHVFGRDGVGKPRIGKSGGGHPIRPGRRRISPGGQCSLSQQCGAGAVCPKTAPRRGMHPALDPDPLGLASG
jgi:hypothetical protein